MHRHCLFATIALSLALFAFPDPVFAQRVRPGSGDERVVSDSQFVASGTCVALYSDGVPVSPAFLRTLEDTCSKIGKLLGHPHDKATLGEQLKVYVTGSTNVSHVWHGYEHQRDPRGTLILSRGAYAGAMRGENATFAHELTHLFTWRFNSHTLREGLADYVALEIMPGAAVGPNVGGYDWSGRIPAEVTVLLGTTIAPPDWVNDDLHLRQAYYFGSYRFVKFLVDKKGLPTFQKLYATGDLEVAFVDLYGKSRKALLEECGI